MGDWEIGYPRPSPCLPCLPVSLSPPLTTAPGVDLQNIPVYNFHMGLVGEAVAQDGDEAVVQLDGDDPAGLGGQIAGEAAQPRPDLQHRVRRGEVGGGGDAGQVGLVHQPVLAQGLLGVQAVLAHEVKGRGDGGGRG